MWKPSKIATALVLVLAAVLLLIASFSQSCTPAQRRAAVPLIRSGGLVCLAIPDEPDHEVCVQAHELAIAVTEALCGKNADSCDLSAYSRAAPASSAGPPDADAR